MRRSEARYIWRWATAIRILAGKNKSGPHWDMIKDLRKGGAIYVDGKLFEKDGQFV